MRPDGSAVAGGAGGRRVRLVGVVMMHYGASGLAKCGDESPNVVVTLSVGDVTCPACVNRLRTFKSVPMPSHDEQLEQLTIMVDVLIASLAMLVTALNSLNTRLDRVTERGVRIHA